MAARLVFNPIRPSDLELMHDLQTAGYVFDAVPQHGLDMPHWRSDGPWLALGMGGEWYIRNYLLPHTAGPMC